MGARVSRPLDLWWWANQTLCSRVHSWVTRMLSNWSCGGGLERSIGTMLWHFGNTDKMPFYPWHIGNSDEKLVIPAIQPIPVVTVNNLRKSCDSRTEPPFSPCPLTVKFHAHCIAMEETICEHCAISHNRGYIYPWPLFPVPWLLWNQKLLASVGLPS